MNGAGPLLRVGVIGSDVSACAFTAFLKRKIPSASVSIFAESKGFCHDIPSRGVSFSSPWIRNDRKGRIAILDLGKDILGLDYKEFIVSDVQSSNSFAHFSASGKNSQNFPSFSSLVANIFAIGLEPFRRGPRVADSNISVHEFLGNRFGVGFARRFANSITRYACACDDAKSVSVHMALPRLVNNLTRCGSVLLGPLAGLLSKAETVGKSKRSADVLDHLWQELMTGGKYVSMGPRLDLSVFRDALTSHVKGLGSVTVSSERILGIEGGQIRTSLGESSFDIIVSSLHAKQTMELFESGEAPKWACRLSQGRDVVCTRIALPDSSRVKVPVWVKAEGNIIGGVYSGRLFRSPEDRICDVFSHRDLSEKDLGDLAISSNEVLAENREKLPLAGLSSCEDLTKFNQWRKRRVLHVDLQVVGKWFYCPSGSISDLIYDACILSDQLGDRYLNFPRTVENEPKSAYINRNDRSLDAQYSDSYSVGQV